MVSNTQEKKQWTIADLVEVLPRGMSDFQMKQFVVASQLTPIKQLQQVTMEAESREENLRKTEYEDKKNQLKIDILKKKRERETDPLYQMEIDLEIHSLEEKIYLSVKEVKRLRNELETFYEILEYFNENYDIGEMLSMKDTLEIDYWVKRLGRQAGLDIVSTGRISTGNLQAMLDLPEEIFHVTLQEALKITNEMAAYIPVPQLGAVPDKETLVKFNQDGTQDQIARS
jgi:hypothetical protein